MSELIDDLMLEYYKHGTHQRLGQYFVNTYIKVDDASTEGIYCELDINKARFMISQFMTNNQWYQLPKKLVVTENTASRFLCPIQEEEQND